MVKKFTLRRLIQPYFKKYIGLGDEAELNALLNPTATTAELTDVDADINTIDKFTGKPAYDTTLSEPVWASGPDPADPWNQARGTVVLPGVWQYDDSTGAADPGSGNFRLNNTTIASATSLFINDESKGGVDFSNILNGLAASNKIYLQNVEDATESLLLTIVTVTDNTGFFTITFTVDDTGTESTWTDGKEFAFIFQV